MDTRTKQAEIAQGDQATDDSKVPASIFRVQTGLRAGVQDDVAGNDAARGAAAAQGARNFLSGWFS